MRAASANAGAIILHGPHHSAQKSTSTGSSVACAKRASESPSIAVGVAGSSGSWQLPHLGPSSSRASGTRLRVRQWAQAICIGTLWHVA